MGKVSKIIGVVVICCIVLVGCNNVIAPDEMAQILYNFYIHEDVSQIEQLGLTQEEATIIIENGISNFETELKESLKYIAGEYEVVIKEEVVKEAIAARRALEKQLVVETQVIWDQNNNSKIKLFTTYFDEEAIYKQASDGLEIEIKNIETEDEEAFVQQCIDIYVQEIIEAYKEAEVSTDKKEMVVEFTNSGKRWLPTQQQDFIDQLTVLTSGYDIE